MFFKSSTKRAPEAPKRLGHPWCGNLFKNSGAPPHCPSVVFFYSSFFAFFRLVLFGTMTKVCLLCLQHSFSISLWRAVLIWFWSWERLNRPPYARGTDTGSHFCAILWHRENSARINLPRWILCQPRSLILNIRATKQLCVPWIISVSLRDAVIVSMNEGLLRFCWIGVGKVSTKEKHERLANDYSKWACFVCTSQHSTNKTNTNAFWKFWGNINRNRIPFGGHFFIKLWSAHPKRNS